MSRKAVVLLVGIIGLADPARAEDPPLVPFVLPWDDAQPGPTDVSSLLSKPAGGRGFLRVRDGHLHDDVGRVRLFGVNLCFGANFPAQDDAPRIAARMAKFGINCVRFHHMDTSASPAGLLKADAKTIDPERLDRLDFLIAELKQHGIYTDLNLHVGRVYPGRPRWGGMPGYFKGVDNFDPEMIAQQQRYARDLLSHTNPYTKTRYAEEPAVALVEINNENALMHHWWNGELDAMPAPYADELGRRWNAWLTDRYQDAEALRAAWGVRSEPQGRELLKNPRFADGLAGWILERHDGAEADARVIRGRADRPEAIVRVTKPGSRGWHVQFNQPGLRLDSKRPYTLRFRARADAPTRVSIAASQAHEPWQALWTTSVGLSPEWKTFRFVFSPSADNANGRISFSDLGSRVGSVELADLSLTTGGTVGLKPDEAPDKIEWFRKRDYASRTPEAQRDWIAFLTDVERGYWTGMARFLRDELGVKSLLVGTQLGWSPAIVQADLDAIDSHAYWQHPHFPGRPWDPRNWTVNNVPMAGRPDGGTLPRLGHGRVVGKPFLCTEYNHSAPNTYSAEAFPLLAAFAARQDWDGIFAFAYSHRGDAWDTGFFGSFFDIDQHPAKMASLPAAAALFLRGDLPPAPEIAYARPSSEDYAAAMRRAGPHVSAMTFGIARADAFRARVGQVLPGTAATDGAPGPAPTGEVLWRPASEGPGVVLVDSPRSKALIGGTASGPFRLGDVTITPGPTRQGFAVITLTVMEGNDFGGARRILITAAGRAENTGMRWSNPEHTSVGRDWGRRPSLVEVIPASIALPLDAGRTRAWALDERGRRGEPVAIASDEPGRSELRLGPPHRTLWYEVEVRR
jgi:hypothetical protein